MCPRVFASARSLGAAAFCFLLVSGTIPPALDRRFPWTFAGVVGALLPVACDNVVTPTYLRPSRIWYTRDSERPAATAICSPGMPWSNPSRINWRSSESASSSAARRLSRALAARRMSPRWSTSGKL
jgi:hypothetical protein